MKKFDQTKTLYEYDIQNLNDWIIHLDNNQGDIHQINRCIAGISNERNSINRSYNATIRLMNKYISNDLLHTALACLSDYLAELVYKADAALDQAEADIEAAQYESAIERDYMNGAGSVYLSGGI